MKTLVLTISILVLLFSIASAQDEEELKFQSLNILGASLPISKTFSLHASAHHFQVYYPEAEDSLVFGYFGGGFKWQNSQNNYDYDLRFLSGPAINYFGRKDAALFSIWQTVDFSDFTFFIQTDFHYRNKKERDFYADYSLEYKPGICEGLKIGIQGENTDDNFIGGPRLSFAKGPFSFALEYYTGDGNYSLHLETSLWFSF